jgi:hypothetical protein
VIQLRYGQRAEATAESGMVRVTGQCSVTGKTHSVVVSESGLIAWLQGALIQNALPRATADEREFLMTGISPEGWQLLDLDDEDDNESSFEDLNKHMREDSDDAL